MNNLLEGLLLAVVLIGGIGAVVWWLKRANDRVWSAPQELDPATPMGQANRMMNLLRDGELEQALGLMTDDYREAIDLSHFAQTVEDFPELTTADRHLITAEGTSPENETVSYRGRLRLPGVAITTPFQINLVPKGDSWQVEALFVADRPVA